jgi:hypothetical protein
MAAQTLSSKLGLNKNAVLSAWIIAGLALLALLAGAALRQSVEGFAAPQQRLGVSAAFPQGWMVEKPIEVSGVVFTARAGLDPSLSYSIGLEPTAQDIQLADLAYNRNLKRSQDLQMYAVLEQEAVTFMGKPAFKVHFAYVRADDPQALPVVIEGLDYYFTGQPKAMVVTLEEETSLFTQALPRFMQFLASVSYGGAK